MPNVSHVMTMNGSKVGGSQTNVDIAPSDVR